MLADRGFDIQDSCGLDSATLQIPSYTKGKPQLSPVLQGCEGVANISDDIVHGRSTEKHNKRLQQVPERLKEKNLILNAEKCKFYTTQLVFVGLVLTDKGIGLIKDKVQAIVRGQKFLWTSKLQCYIYPRLCHSCRTAA